MSTWDESRRRAQLSSLKEGRDGISELNRHLFHDTGRACSYKRTSDDPLKGNPLPAYENRGRLRGEHPSAELHPNGMSACRIQLLTQRQSERTTLRWYTSI